MNSNSELEPNPNPIPETNAPENSAESGGSADQQMQQI